MSEDFFFVLCGLVPFPCLLSLSSWICTQLIPRGVSVLREGPSVAQDKLGSPH